MKKKLNVSLVIPSHKGKKKLSKLINSIKENTFLPKEIIICGTNKSDINLINKEDIKSLNIIFLLSKIKNQVYQRKKAIDNAKYDLIFQLDDDVILEKNYIFNMSKHFKLGNEKKVVSAIIFTDKKKHQGIRWNNAYYKNFLFRKCLYFLNGFQKIRYMSIIKSGRIIPLMPREFLNYHKMKNSKKFLKNVQWVCSSNAYLKKYRKEAFLFQTNNKKSYFEDVFFSHSLYQKKFNLLIDGSCIAYHSTNDPTNFFNYRNTISSQYNIVKLFKKNLLLFYLDVFIFSLVHIFITKK